MSRQIFGGVEEITGKTAYSTTLRANGDRRLSAVTARIWFGIRRQRANSGSLAVLGLINLGANVCGIGSRACALWSHAMHSAFGRVMAHEV